MGSDEKAASKRVTIEDIHVTAERVTNWGRWGPADEIGTLNNVTPQDNVGAARLIRRGRVFSLALNFDKQRGPRAVWWGNRFNPIHTMFSDRALMR